MAAEFVAVLPINIEVQPGKYERKKEIETGYVDKDLGGEWKRARIIAGVEDVRCIVGSGKTN